MRHTTWRERRLTCASRKTSLRRQMIPRKSALLQTKRKLRRSWENLIHNAQHTLTNKHKLANKRKRSERWGISGEKKSRTTRRRGARSSLRDVRSTWSPTTSEASTVKASRGLWKSWSARKLHSSSAWMRPSYKPHCASRTTSPIRPARKEVGDAGQVVILEHRSS